MTESTGLTREKVVGVMRGERFAMPSPAALKAAASGIRDADGPGVAGTVEF